MGVRLPSVFSVTFVGPLPAGGAETAVLTTPPLNIPFDNAQIYLAWFASVIAGTSVINHGFRIRRGVGVAGAQVGVNMWNDTIAATNQKNSSGWYIDTPGAVAGQQYTLTLVQTSATAAGFFQDGALLAYVL